MMKEEPDTPSDDYRAQWPLSFRHDPTKVRPIGNKRYWSHSSYRGPQNQPVKIHYSRTKAESEEIAQLFLDEPVVGFDMEWPWDSDKLTRLQHKIGLIQIACEDKIALFHIGLHTGNKPNDLLAPSLRNIIESPHIKKTGVAVLNADFSRLRTWFQVSPRGAFELSHLHNLVTYGGRDPKRCTTKLFSLSNHVEKHLGLPLHKGKVRTSNWSKPLNDAQIAYAAADAYAGFMLYHCMNGKRVLMDPTPPLPLHADDYAGLKMTLGKSAPLLLASVDGTTKFTIASDFFGKQDAADAENISEDVARKELVPDPESESDSDSDSEFETMVTKGGVATPAVAKAKRTDAPIDAESPMQDVKVLRAVHRHHIRKIQGGGVVVDEASPIEPAPKSLAADDDDEVVVIQFDGTFTAPSSKWAYKHASTQKQSGSSLDTASKVLFERLRTQRNRIAEERSVKPFQIAHNSLLEDIARTRPQNAHQLGGIKGVGRKKLEDFGDGWLETVILFLEEEEEGQHTRSSPIEEAVRIPVSSPRLPPIPTEEPDEEPALPRPTTPIQYPTLPTVQFVTPQPKLPPTPQLHTGLSFKMEETTLTTPKYFAATGMDFSDDLLMGPTAEVLKRKRLANQSQTTPGPKIARTASVTRSPERKPEPMSPASRIFKSKLVAFSKVVTGMMETKPSGPLVSDKTIDLIVARPPRNMEDLLHVPGVLEFANACSRANLPLLDRIIKFAPPAPVSVGGA